MPIRQQEVETDPGPFFIQVILGNADERAQAFQWIEAHWDNQFTVMALETIRVTDNAKVRKRLLEVMETHTHQRFEGYNA
ncbi:MAG: hypothetical protein ACFB10_19705 [Salibacteraceae bacterium]